MASWLEDDDGGKEVRLLEIFMSLAERARLGNENEDKVGCMVLYSSSSLLTQCPSDDRANHLYLVFVYQLEVHRPVLC